MLHTIDTTSVENLFGMVRRVKAKWLVKARPANFSQ